MGSKGNRLGSSADRRHPAQQEKVVAAKRAAIGPHEPVQSLLHNVSNAYSSKVHRFTVRTLRREHNCASFLTVGLRRAVAVLNNSPGGGSRIPQVGANAASTSGGAARIAGSLDLFGRSHVGLG